MPRKTAQAAPYTLMTLACTTLQVDVGIQPRLTLNSAFVEEYATLYQEAEVGQEPLPPLDVFQVVETYYVADGFHRLQAAREASRESVPCHVYVGTRRDAMVHAAFANVRRGLPYSYGDKQQVLERLLADPDIAQRGDRALARDLGMSHMTVWRTRTRLAEEARLQAEIAAMPATATAPEARAQEQIAAYLAVPAETVKQSLGPSIWRYESPQAIMKDIVRQKVLYNTTTQEATDQVARYVANAATNAAKGTRNPLRTTPRPSMSTAAIAERKATARREHLFMTLRMALDGLVQLYPLTPEEQGLEADDPAFLLPPTAEELVAAVLPQDVEYVGELLSQAHTMIEALQAAWQTRTRTDQAAALA